MTPGISFAAEEEVGVGGGGVLCLFLLGGWFSLSPPLDDDGGLFTSSLWVFLFRVLFLGARRGARSNVRCASHIEVVGGVWEGCSSAYLCLPPLRVFSLFRRFPTGRANMAAL